MTETNINNVYDVEGDKSYLNAIAKRNAIIDYLNDFKIDDGNECKSIGIKKDIISQIDNTKVKINVGDNLNTVMFDLGNKVERGCRVKDLENKEITVETMFEGLTKMLANKFNDHNFINILNENFEKGKEQYRELGRKAIESQISNLGLNDVISCTKKNDISKSKIKTKKTMKNSFKTELASSLRDSLKRHTEKDDKIKTGIFEIKTKSGQVYEVEINNQKDVKLYRCNQVVNGQPNRNSAKTEIKLNSLGKDIGDALSKKIMNIVSEKIQTASVGI